MGTAGTRFRSESTAKIVTRAILKREFSNEFRLGDTALTTVTGVGEGFSA